MCSSHTGLRQEASRGTAQTPDETAIRVSNLSKCYQIYDRPQDRLKQSILPRLQRLVAQAPKYYYREFWALKDVSLEVKRGETIGIVGRNGSGKSTLLQLICGTLYATSGTIETNGRIAALLELGSGFNPEFTGRENVYMNGALLGLSRDEMDSRFDQIAAFADIGQFIDQPLKTYSSGMMVRLAFSVAVSVDADLLIVDEALAVGDEAFQRKCFARIDSIRDNGATILFVSHSGSAVLELCDRAVLFDAGELLTAGSPKRVVSLYHKLIYSPPDKALRVRDGIRCGDLDPEATTEAPTEDSRESVTADSGSPPLPKDWFDPDMTPRSTVRYESRGAVIEAPRIRNSAGRAANVLTTGERYSYIYSVKFTRAATDVRCGMLIKTTSGLEVGGAVSHPPGQQLGIVAAGTTLEVEFGFSCFLNPGVYFLNAGVLGSIDGLDGYIDRIIDAAMFRVQPQMGSLGTAIVNFAVTPSVVIKDG
jgi:lipopolysaccharide transport system ATP-binding protein